MRLVPTSSRARTLTLVATALGSAIAFLDTTVVIVALPRMEEDLGLGLAGQQWVYLSYTLTLAALYLVSGALGDRFGLRRMFVVGVVLFALASLGCAVAQGESSLIAARALQGIGGAALTTTSLALLRVVWAEDAGRAIGLWTSLTSMATVAGPPLGGALVEWTSWRLVFLINVPLSIAVIVLALAARAPNEKPEARATLDLVGSTLFGLGLVGVTYALVEAPDKGLRSVALVGILGVAALVGLVLWTHRSPSPVVPPSLLRLPGIASANVTTLLVYAALGAHLLYFPLALQFLGLTPFEAGFAFTPPSLGLILLAPRFGALADRNGPRRYIAGGSALIAVAVLLLLPLPGAGGLWVWAPLSLALFAVGLPMIVAPITAAALEPAPEALAGVAAGLNQTVARIGGLLSVAGVGLVVTLVYSAAGGPDGNVPLETGLEGAARGASVDAFRAALLVIASIALLAAVVAATRLRDRASEPLEADLSHARP